MARGAVVCSLSCHLRLQKAIYVHILIFWYIHKHSKSTNSCNKCPFHNAIIHTYMYSKGLHLPQACFRYIYFIYNRLVASPFKNSINLGWIYVHWYIRTYVYILHYRYVCMILIVYKLNTLYLLEECTPRHAPTSEIHHYV